MPSLAEIKRQIEACPGRYIFWTQKEVRALPQILDQDESIKAITSGLMDATTWLAVCTNRRLLFINRGMFYGLRQVQLPLDRIQSLDHEFTIFFGSIRVWDGASAFTIRMVLKSSIMPFVKTTQEAMHQLRTNQNKAPSATGQPLDIASQLAKLAELKEKGYLTDAEFQAQKKKLLG
jgi:hypothetical protein